MRLFLTFLVTVVAATSLLGCLDYRTINSELIVVTSVVIDGKSEIPDAGFLTGETGFYVNALVVIPALGGTVEVIDNNAILVQLRGKSVLVSLFSRDVHADVQLKVPVVYGNGVWELSGPDLKFILDQALPNGKAIRRDNRVYIWTETNALQ